MIEINNQEEMEKYFNEDCKIYTFEKNVKFNTPIDVEYGIVAKRSIVANWNIRTREHILVKGCIKTIRTVKAVWSIMVEGDIEARGDIISEENIKAGGDIKAGWSIIAKRAITAGKNITAGVYIYSYTFDINCKSMSTKKLPFYRKFWAEMPPLRKYKEAILDDSKCWKDYKIPKEEAIEICKWDGWHWILRAQLEMFFGLKNRYVLNEGE